MRRIRLTEGKLRKIISECVKQCLYEYDKSSDYMTFRDTTLGTLDDILNSTPSKLSDTELKHAVNYLQAYGYQLNEPDKEIARDFYDEMKYRGLY